MYPQYQPNATMCQTRQVQDLVPLTGVEVRVLSSALLTGQGVTATPDLLPRAISPPHGKILVKRLG